MGSWQVLLTQARETLYTATVVTARFHCLMHVPQAAHSALPGSSQAAFFEEWKTVFRNPQLDTQFLRGHCLEGKLRDSRLRSVVWRVLPFERLEWAKILKERREQYESLKKKLNTNPRSAIFVDNPDLNNPLSLKDENPWHQYFLDEELRECIRKDVDRTFPELQFFQSHTTKRIMSDILFVYAKQNDHVSYRQGMHEVLAPILFVIYFDHRSFEHLLEQNGLGSFTDFELDTLRMVNRHEFLEHDAFALFQQLMLLLEGWYLNDEDEEEQMVGDFCQRARSQGAQPFERRLEHVTEYLLPHVDPMLHQHLHNLDIPPQLYGIRWLRLLFGREFPLHDLLYLWDVIFADSLGVCDFVCLALLVQVRHLLLCADYSAALQYLMRYPPTVDIQAFVQLVLHLEYPQNCGLSLYTHMTLAGKAHPNADRDLRPPAETAAGKSNVVKNVRLRSVATDIVLNKLGRQALSATAFPIRRQRPNDGCAEELTSIERIDPKGEPVSADASDGADVELMQEQVCLLQRRLNDLDLRSQRAARKLLDLADELERGAERPLEAQQQLEHVQCLRDTATELRCDLGGGPGAEKRAARPAALQRAGLAPPPPSAAPPRRSLEPKAGEMIELHFKRKKNY